MRKDLVENKLIKAISQKYDITPEQLLLYFVLKQENVVAIPRAGIFNHINENSLVAELKITDDDLEKLSIEFPAPTRKTFLDML